MSNHRLRESLPWTNRLTRYNSRSSACSLSGQTAQPRHGITRCVATTRWRRRVLSTTRRLEVHPDSGDRTLRTLASRRTGVGDSRSDTEIVLGGRRTGADSSCGRIFRWQSGLRGSSTGALASFVVGGLCIAQRNATTSEASKGGPGGVDGSISRPGQVHPGSRFQY